MPSSSSNVVIDTPHLGLLQVTGVGAKPLLQGQLTCHLDEISLTQSRLGAHCNPQGRILSLFRLFTFRSDYYLQLPIEILLPTLEALQKYAVFFKVNLLDASHALHAFSYTGTELANLFPALPQNSDDVISNDDVVILKTPSKTPFYTIIGESSTINTTRTALLKTAKHESSNTWKSIQISAGIPSIYTQTIGKFLPHELNLQQLNGISFTKGCYTGQEIIARMQYRGQLKKHLYLAEVKTNTLPEPGSDIYHDAACGTLVDYCEIATNHYRLLIIANESDVEHHTLFLDPAKTVAVECISLPVGSTYV